MNYIGSKYSLIDFLETSIDKTLKLYNESRQPSEMVFADLFAGTGVVSGSFKKQGYSIIANDIQYYSYVITKHMIENNGNLNKSRCNQLIEELDPSYKRKTRLNLKGSNEFHLAERKGFEPLRQFPDDRISSAARYDLFDISPI